MTIEEKRRNDISSGRVVALKHDAQPGGERRLGSVPVQAPDRGAGQTLVQRVLELPVEGDVVVQPEGAHVEYRLIVLPGHPVADQASQVVALQHGSACLLCMPALNRTSTPSMRLEQMAA